MKVLCDFVAVTACGSNAAAFPTYNIRLFMSVPCLRG
jgi:hypothetical protein